MKTGFIEMGDNRKNIVYQITETNCYEVISHCSSGSRGYHKIRFKGKSMDLHRWIYMKFNPIIDISGLIVRHKCDNRSCINIDHLEHGTAKDNVDDMIKRNRQYCKLKEADILEILKLHNQGLTQYEIAEKFNISRESISGILCGKSWVRITKILHNKRINSCDEKYIFFDSSTNKWRVVIYHQNKKINLGRFSELKEAIAVRDAYLK